MAEESTMNAPWGAYAPDYDEVPVLKDVPNFDLELVFTETYRQYEHAHPAIREAQCLKVLFPKVFQPIKMGDVLAGRTLYRQIGFGLEQASGGPGFYCHTGELRTELESAQIDAATREQLEQAIAYWDKHATIEGKLLSILPEDVKAATSNRIASMGGRLSGSLLNFEKLVHIGIPGLRAEIEAGLERAQGDGGDTELYQAMLMALDVLVRICDDYAEQALALASKADDPVHQADLRDMAASLHAISVNRPATLREGIQLVWLYALIAGAVNYGRLDIALGDLYAGDIDSGRLTEAEALRLLLALWQKIADRHIFFNGRIIVGGRGRSNEANADRFALAAMEATRTVIETEPQLSLRFYKGQNPALMAKALDVLGEGRTFPMLYNDDINIPAVMNAFVVPEDDAVHYLPYGCGEYALNHTSFGSPNCAFNLLKALEATLFNGKDSITGQPLGLALGEFRDFETFDDLFEAYGKQVTFHANKLAVRHGYEYQAERESAAFLFMSMLYDGCIEKGKSVVDGGTKYLGGVAESFGLINTADSLAAIKKLVYDDKLLTQDELLAALQVNFEGYEQVRTWMLDAPKYGNDDPYVDSIAQRASDQASQTVRDQAADAGIDYYLMVNINNFFNVALGLRTGASADGRRLGDPLANGSTPTAGMDRKGVTAFLNSITKLDPKCHAGYVHNMKFSKQMFGADRIKLEALLGTYFAKGGTQAMITCVSKGDLEAAMNEPEKYRNLIVRVGGFSARFVELDRKVQQDLIKRTLY